MEIKIKEQLPSIQKNIPLAPLTTFKIGGPARYFFVVENKDDLVKAVKAAKAVGLEYFILGGGSNLLVSDKGFEGLVIQTRNSKFEIRNGMVEAESGTFLSQLVAASIQSGLTGLEWAVGIPGTIGGAVYNNTGAYGHSISDAVEEVEVLDENENGVTRTVLGFVRFGRTNKEMPFRRLLAKDCGYGYKKSVFMDKPWVILAAKLKLGKGDREKSQEEIAEYLADRRRRIPPYPSAGSVFKNIVVSDLRPATRKSIPEDRIKGGKAPVWYFISQVGLAGKRVGGAEIPEQHANIFVNTGGAKAADIAALIDSCKKEVKKKFGIELEEEVRYLGF